MPQRIVTMYVCSLCENESETTDFTETWQLTGPDAAVELDLCKQCRHGDERFLALAEIETWQNGRSAATAEPVEPVLTCPRCEKTSRAPQGMAAHMLHAHGLAAGSLAAYRAGKRVRRA